MIFHLLTQYYIKYLYIYSQYLLLSHFKNILKLHAQKVKADSSCYKNVLKKINWHFNKKKLIYYLKIFDKKN